MNVNKLKGKLVERGMNVEKLAEAMGRDRSYVYRKMNESEKFTIGDARAIKEILELTNEEAQEIFLV